MLIRFCRRPGLFSEAVNHYQAGRLDAARVVCKSILAQQAEHAHAIHLTGVIAMQQGDLNEAERLIRRALQASPAEVGFLNTLATKRRIVFPVHPRTLLNLRTFGLADSLHPAILVTEPIGYIDFLALTAKAELVITDSGGIQEETTYLGVPCVTVRENTERPITVTTGTNFLAGTDLPKVAEITDNILQGNKKKGNIPELWDGWAAERIVEIIIQRLVA